MKSKLVRVFLSGVFLATLPAASNASQSLCAGFTTSNCSTFQTNSGGTNVANTSLSNFTGLLAGQTFTATGLLLNLNKNSSLSLGTQGSTLSSDASISSVSSGQNVYSKYTSGDYAETGLGLAGDPSSQHEIYYTPPTGTSLGAMGVIQLNVTNVRSAGATDLLLEIGSITGSDAFAIWGSNSALSGSTTSSMTLLYSGTSAAGAVQDFDLAAIPKNGGGTLNDFSTGYNYYYVTATGGNVVLDAVAATVATPEPDSFVLIGLGMIALACLFGNRSRKRAE